MNDLLIKNGNLMDEKTPPREYLRKQIDFVFNEEEFIKLSGCKAGTKAYNRSMELLKKAAPLLQPSFAIRRFSIGESTDVGVEVGGIGFLSKILANKLAQADEGYTYIATCGRMIGDLLDETKDYLDIYLLSQFAYLAYLQAMEELSVDAELVFGVERQIRLCPGTVIDWSIDEVKKIFALMDGMYQELEVEVKDSGLIYPLKSSCGIFYATQEEFESCSICSKANCCTRRMPFDEALHEEMVNL